MPKSPAASKREVITAFRAAQSTTRAVDELWPVLEQVARDNEVSKSILTRNLKGRLRWIFLGR